MEFKLILFAQYPALLLLSLLFLVNCVRARKSSVVRFVVWMILLILSLVAAIVFCILGTQAGYWTLKTLFPLKVWSWVGIAVVAILFVSHVIHRIERRHSRRLMEKELRRAEEEKAEAVARAREEGRSEARREAEAEAAAEAAAEEAIANGATPDAPLPPIPEPDVPADAAAEPGETPPAEA